MQEATILVKQQRTVIPFDVTNYRCIVYSPFVREKAIGKIAEAITDAISSSEKLTDSPVYEVYPNLVVVNTDATAKSPLLPWELYWERIVSIASLLAEAGVEGRYNPNAILGISNGGGAFLDFLVRKMNFDGPVACLWANRRHADPDHPDYINNPINRGLIEGVKKAINTSPDETRILIVDDLVASGTTSGMAIRFLRNQFVGCHLRFLPLVCRDVIMNKEIDKILIGGTAASITIKSASTAFTWSKRAGFPTIRTYRHIWDSYQR